MTQISTADTTAQHIQTRTALYPGTFRPFTIGHADIVGRALEIFDKIIIAAGRNREKETITPGEDHNTGDRDIAAIKLLYADNPRVQVITYNTLTAETAKRLGAKFLLRGVRSVKDFEYEREMAHINSQLFGLETVILFSRPELAAISSSTVRELAAFGHDVSNLLPRK